MSDDMDFCDCEDCEDEPVTKIKGSPLTWTDPVVIGVGLVEDILDSFSAALGAFKYRVAAHANYKIERRDFAADASREIEKLTAPAEETK